MSTPGSTELPRPSSASSTGRCARPALPHVVQAAGNLFGVFFVETDDVTEIRDFDDANRQALHRHRAFFHAMLDAGVYLPPSAFEAWFVSAAHDDQALDRIAAALPGAAAAAACARSDR